MIFRKLIFARPDCIVFRTQQLSDLCYFGLAPSVCKQPIVTDLMKSIRQHMQQKTSDKLCCPKLAFLYVVLRDGLALMHYSNADDDHGV